MRAQSSSARWLLAPAAGLFLAATVPSGDSVTVTGVPVNRASLALLQGQYDGTCNYDFYWINGTEAADSYQQSTSCTGRVSVSMPFKAFNVVDAGWTNGDDNVSLALLPRLEVPLNVWVVVRPRARPRSLFDRRIKRIGADVLRAVRIFNSNAAGVAFRPVWLSPPIDPLQRFLEAGTPVALRLGTGCDAVASVRSLGEPWYSAGAINVYYVTGPVGGPINDLPGWNCYDPTLDGIIDAPDIIYMSLFSSSPTTLAHELAHALGHQGRCTEHVDWAGLGYWSDGCDYTGTPFDRFNLMRTTDPSAVMSEQEFDAARGELTFGQIFKMNVHENSWLNIDRGAGLGRFRSGPRAACADAFEVWDPCVPLARLEGEP